VADIQKRGSYTPRRARERRAYQLVLAGGVAGVVGVVGIVLAAIGTVGAGLHRVVPALGRSLSSAPLGAAGAAGVPIH
jgi:hypothetical protein